MTNSFDLHSVTALSPSSSNAEALGSTAKSSKEDAKIEKSARDFEAILLGSWLQSAEETFAKVPGNDSEEEGDSGGDQFVQIAMQSLGTSLAGSGGIGIAKLIARQLHNTTAASADKGVPGNPNQTSSPEAIPRPIEQKIQPADKTVYEGDKRP